MRTIVIAILIGLFFQFDSFAQSNQFSANDDTLTFYTRTGGQIDTFDLTYTFPLTPLPGGTISRYNSVPTIDFYRNSPSLLRIAPKESDHNWIVSALPHIGFFYSFGTKGAQFLHADYQQVFKNKSLLNLEINRSSSSEENAMVRNGGFSNQSFKGAYRFKIKKVSGVLAGKYNQNTTSLNGGISNDSSWIEQGIGFAPVRKINATSLERIVNFSGAFKYNILGDSSSFQLGILTKHKFNLWNRVYNESSDTLSSLFSSINIDSLKTTDQFQDAKLKNSIGVFSENKFFFAEATLSHRYWRFQNLGRNRDTNEISTELNIAFNKRKLHIASENYLNLVGAQNEFSTYNKVKWGSKSRYLGISASLESLLPTLIQRFYFANNLNYSNPLIKQYRSDIQLSGAYSIWKINGEVSIGSLNWNNNLQWSNNNWTITDKSNQNIAYAKAKLHFNFNWFQFYPEVQINQGSEFLPNYIISSRVLVKTKVFAAKKLEISFALDPQLSDKYKMMSYNTLLDNWYFQDGNRVGGQIFTLHSTLTLHIEEFRFFVRTENFQSFWTAKNIEIAQSYYRPTFLLRLGISWDFFN